MTISSVDAIIVVNIVNRKSGKKLIILRVWLDPLPRRGAAPFRATPLVRVRNEKIKVWESRL